VLELREAAGRSSPSHVAPCGEAVEKTGGVTDAQAGGPVSRAHAAGAQNRRLACKRRDSTPGTEFRYPTRQLMAEDEDLQLLWRRGRPSSHTSANRFRTTR
jgi:hypothetical protein